MLESASGGGEGGLPGPGGVYLVWGGSAWSWGGGVCLVLGGSAQSWGGVVSQHALRQTPPCEQNE